MTITHGRLVGLKINIAGAVSHAAQKFEYFC